MNAWPGGLRRGSRRIVFGVVIAGTVMLGLPRPATATPTPSITIGDVTVVEGNVGTTAATFTIQASPPPKPSAPLQLSWATAAATATAGTDFTTSSGTVSLTKANPSRTVTVPVVGDVLDEPSETFVVNLSNLVGSPGTIGDAQGLGTITDDDGLPVLSVNDTTVVEGDAGVTTATFTISLAPASGRSVTVNWATTAGTATAGTDYVATSGVRTIAAGSTSATVNITVNGDTVDEPNETFGISLSGPTNASLGDAAGVATIADDDAAPVLSVNDTSVTEGNAGTVTATFTISLSGPSGQAVSVNWATTAGTATAGTDYLAASGGRTIAAGSTSATVSITVNGDALDEADETFGISLTGPTNASLGDAAGVGTITDDDPAPGLSIADVSAAEGNVGSTTFSFAVTLSAPSGRTVTVQWATADDEASSASDYAPASGTLTFVPGDTTETASVTVNGDLVAELDEGFTVTLSSAANATIVDGIAVGTIVDDEGLPVIDLLAQSVPEGDAGITSLPFTVVLSHPSALPVTVEWDTADATALAGSDFTAASGTVSFAAMDVSETVVIDVMGDDSFESDETLALELSNATNAPIGRSRRLGTIANDDAAPVVSIGDTAVVEGDSGSTAATFTVTLSAASDLDASVGYATSDGTATGGSDFVPTSGTLTVPAGETSATIEVPVTPDSRYEPDETFTVDLSGPVDASIGDGAGQGTIENDDPVKTTITIAVVKGTTLVKAKGVLEPTQAGHHVTVTLYRRTGGAFVRVAAKTVSVKRLGDRDGDGKTDGKYVASFTRPAAGGSFKLVAHFAGTPSHKPSTTSKRFTLAPR
jgi:chitinase